MYIYEIKSRGRRFLTPLFGLVRHPRQTKFSLGPPPLQLHLEKSDYTYDYI